MKGRSPIRAFIQGMSKCGQGESKTPPLPERKCQQPIPTPKTGMPENYNIFTVIYLNFKNHHPLNAIQYLQGSCLANL